MATEAELQSELVAQANHRTLTGLIERAPFGIYAIDSDFRIAQLNQRALNGAFRNVRPVIGRDFAEAMRIIWPESAGTYILAQFQRTLDTGEPYYSSDFIETRRDLGIVESYEWELHRMTLADGRPGVVCYYFESTQIRSAEAALRASEQRLALVASGARIGMFEWNMDTGKAVWNERHAMLLGLQSESPLRADRATAILSVEHDYRDWARCVHPQDLARVEAEMSESLAAGQPYESEYRVIWPDGSVHWLVGRGIFVGGPDDGGGRMLGMTMDITPRKRAEEELREANTALASRNEQLARASAELMEVNEKLEQRVMERTARLRELAGEVTRSEERERRRIGTVLHDDLQQLLVAAQMHLGAAREPMAGGAGGPLTEADQLLRQAVAVTRALSHDLSLVVLHEQGLVSALKWIADWMRQHHGLLVEVETANSTALEPGGEEIRVALFQSVRELLFNVTKHSGAARAALRMAATPDQKHVEIIVSDQGAGFDPGEAAVSPKPGIGLFSIRERLQSLGGSMDLHSAPGIGTRIRLVAPLYAADFENEPLPGTTLRDLPAPSAPPAAGNRPTRIRVLLVDDHKLMRDALGSTLGRQPELDVVGVAVDGCEAVEQAFALQPQVVLMDVNMPRMNGMEATRRIKEMLPHTAVIGLTMHADTACHEGMREAGAATCLVKSDRIEDLLQTIEEVAEGD